MSKPSKICYVSAFLDIGREKWHTYPRDISTYLRAFSPYVDMFKRDLPNHEMIVFIDKVHHQALLNLVKDSKIKCIPIDEDFMKENIHVWSMLDKETEIMNSAEYKDAFYNRMSNPENTQPKYTLINHAKIDFVNHAMSLTTAEYFAWVDFGYFQHICNIPTNPLSLHKLDCDKVNYQILNNLDDNDSDIIYTISEAPERFGGFFFFGNRAVLQEYQKLYHSVLKEFQELNLADDDQHVAMRCYFAKPEMFKLHHNSSWHKALIMFQEDLKEIMNRHGSDKGSGHHNYIDMYTKLFESRRFERLNVLEIGIGSVNPVITSNMCGKPGGYSPGSSLKGWKEYFPNSNIYGCDIDRDILISEERISTFHLDQTNFESIQRSIVDVDREYDIIIDDGYHHFPTNWAVLKQIYPKLKKGGIYVIEDILDYNPQVLSEDFAAGKDITYHVIDNPQNRVDNNLLVILK